MLNSLPLLPTVLQLGLPPAAGPLSMAPSVDTHIEAGTPYWVPMEGVECEPVFVPGPPFEFGTFRECSLVE